MTRLDRPMLVAAICLLVATFLMTFPSHHEFDCFAGELGGVMYCTDQNGHIVQLQVKK